MKCCDGTRAENLLFDGLWLCSACGMTEIKMSFLIRHSYLDAKLCCCYSPCHHNETFSLFLPGSILVTPLAITNLNIQHFEIPSKIPRCEDSSGCRQRRILRLCTSNIAAPHLYHYQGRIFIYIYHHIYVFMNTVRVHQSDRFMGTPRRSDSSPLVVRHHLCHRFAVLGKCQNRPYHNISINLFNVRKDRIVASPN